MSRNLWLIGAGILIVAIVVSLLLSRGSGAPSQTATSTQVTFPTSGEASSTPSGGNSISVAEIQQGSIPVRDFLSDPTTLQDPHNTGYYYLAGGLAPNPSKTPYIIEYDQTHQYFGIALLQEPLGQYRTEAEQFLQKELGVSEAEMCSLNYFIGVAPGVNDLYLSKNLGFSFCPGAVALP